MKAILLDLNGIFIKSPKLSERFEATYGVPAATFVEALKEVMAVARMPGCHSSILKWHPHFLKWGLPNLGSEEFFRFWFSAEKEDAEMIQLAEKIKKEGLDIFVISNNFRERTEFYSQRFGWLATLPKKLYYSWQTGNVKPDRAAYQQVLRENNLQGPDVIYFDDSAENVAAASHLGIVSYRFKNIGQVRDVIKDVAGLKLS